MTITLKQFEQRGQAKIFLDMDGVLCDFIKGVKDTTVKILHHQIFLKAQKVKSKHRLRRTHRFGTLLIGCPAVKNCSDM